MRGLQKSRSIDSILWEVEKLLDNNVKEIMVIAQDSRSYGWDLKPKSSLANLIKELTNLELIGLGCTTLTGSFIIKNNRCFSKPSNFCRYIDIPVQHGSDKILKSMRRGLDKWHQ